MRRQWLLVAFLSPAGKLFLYFDGVVAEKTLTLRVCVRYYILICL